MTLNPRPQDELRDLLWSIEDGSISAGGIERIDELVRGDPELMRQYIEYTRLLSDLRFGLTNGRAQDVLGWLFDIDRGLDASAGGLDASAGGLGTSVPSEMGGEQEEDECGTLRDGSSAPSPALLVPPIIIDTSTRYHPPFFSLHSPLGGILFSYGVATLITGIAILGTWLYKVSPDSKAAPDQPLLARSGEEPEPKYVGGITGSAGCRWADPQDVPSAAVPLGRKYELASGLVEISYHSGAKVILQGPCRYEVDSAAGGFLSLGKLTARVETQGEGGRGKAEEAGVGAAVQLPHQPGAEESPFPLLPSAFVIRTPTAIVTDLGTEFGVEVNREGATTSHVFRGSVKVQLAAGGRPQERREVVLRENESARVQRGQDAGGPRLDFRDVGSQLPNFVRRLAEPPKELDLLDIVAGGDGTGHRREAGLDPTTGMRDTWFAPQDRWGDGKYRPVPWQPLLDGVFVPPGDGAPVALDSAGHTFAGFRNTNGHVWASIWARAAEVKPDNRAKDPSFWIYAIGASRQFMPEGCGLLAFHANGGVTFNLETMRQVHEGVRPARFQAVAAVASAHRVSPTQNDGAVDLWVFVDGRLVQKRIDLGPEQGPVRLDVSLRPADRFLTLVVTGPGTDGGGGWFVLGDPLLQMTPMASEKPAKNGPQPEGGASMNGP